MLASRETGVGVYGGGGRAEERVIIRVSYDMRVRAKGKNSGQRKWRVEELVPRRKSQSPPVLSVRT